MKGSDKDEHDQNEKRKLSDHSVGLHEIFRPYTYLLEAKSGAGSDANPDTDDIAEFIPYILRKRKSGYISSEPLSLLFSTREILMRNLSKKLSMFPQPPLYPSLYTL